MDVREFGAHYIQYVSHQKDVVRCIELDDEGNIKNETVRPKERPPLVDLTEDVVDYHEPQRKRRKVWETTHF